MATLPSDSPPRRSISPSEHSELTRLRHSPALNRSFDPNDPQVRERQRTMDVDMAMQLSLARRDTLLSASPQGMSPPVPDEDAFSLPQQDFALLDDHAADMHFGDEDHADPDTRNHIQPSLRRMSRSDPSLLSRHHVSPHGEDPQASNFGLPTYQANVSQSAFDFTGMEEFAAEEKDKLGLNSPNKSRFSLSAQPRRPKLSVVEPPPPVHSQDADPNAAASSSTQLPATPGDALQPADGHPSPEEDQGSSRPLRHRKLSQNITHPRSHRKGIGGKMALFESVTSDPPSSFSARLGQVLGQHSGPSAGPAYDAVPGLPVPGGILNTGHARPYRFSFYSNALSATIHARSLAELPAEGQTFAQLFAGMAPPPLGSQDGTTLAGDAKAAPQGKASPPYQEAAKALPSGAGKTNGAGPNDHSNEASGRNSATLNKRTGAGGPEKGGHNGMVGAGVAMDQDGDGNTWWLDVQSPTDEEMKMLSKVSCSSLCCPCRLSA